MTSPDRSRTGQAIHYFPILAVMIFWLGAGLIGSLMVDTPHITRLGLVTLPLLAAAVAASIKIHRALNKKD